MHPARLLLLLVASSTLLHPAAASNDGDNGTAATCAPATCGTLNITYPFTLIGAQPLHCGYPAFALACDHLTGRAYLSRTFRDRLYLVHNISYGDASLTMSVETTFAGNASCRIPDFNVSAGLALFPLHVSAGNDDLVFVHNCTLPRKLTPRPVSCGSHKIEAFVVASDGSVADALPENCSFVTVPVRRGGVARDYERLIGDGFLSEWEKLGDCGACSRGGGECRFEDGSFRCVCQDASSPCSSRDTRKFGLKIGAGIAAALLCLVVLTIVCIIHNIRMKRKRSASLNGLIIRGGSPLASPRKEFTLAGSLLTHIFTYEELDEATDGFSDARVLGAGGFGTVYKGILRDGSVVAVKRSYKNSYKGVEQFANEVDILSRLRHPNLVTLYGCTSSSSQGSELLLAYEFVPNGTLANHLHCGGEAPLLAWPTRLGVAVEAASALAYLHAHQIVHRDVKTTNILLDKEFHVKVADFGLCRLFPSNTTLVSTAPQGTPGYVDPAYHHRYQLTDKSDVYSFGVVLVELISSRPAVDMTRVGTDVNLASMAVRMIQCCEIDQLVDQRLGYGTASETMRTVDLVAEVAFRCLQPEQDVRPCITEVLGVLWEAHQSMMEKGGCVVRDDVVFVKKSRDGSPDTVMHQWISPSTTTSHST